MSIRTKIRKIAPFLDNFDVLFGIVLLGILLAVQFSQLRYPGAIALITACTAFFALYRLRHRPQKVRPAVREDFDKNEDEYDFGLRNFGPGPALYLQGVVTVERGENVDTILHFTPHDRPIHLDEGEFVGFVHEPEKEWLDEVLNEYGLKEDVHIQENPAMVNLYYSYVSRSGTREPIEASTDRDDDIILSKIKNPESDARSIELWRLAKDCKST